MGKKACPDHEIDKLTSWWVRASKTHPRRIIFFRWFSDSDYHSTHDITPYHSINFSLQFIIPASRSSGKEFGPTWNWKHFFLSHAHLPVANGSYSQEVLGVKLCEIIWNSKQKVYHMWKQWSYSDPVFTSEFLGEKGNKLNNEIHASCCDVQCDHSNYDVKPRGTGQLEENVSITYTSNTTKRWQSQASDTVNNACFGFDDQTNCPKNTRQIWYIYTYYVVKSCGRLFWSHSNCTISNWKAGSCRPSRFLHCVRVHYFQITVSARE